MACLGLERELQVRAPTGPAGSSTPYSATWSLSCPPPPRLARTPGLPMGLPGRDSQLPRPALWLQSLSQGPRGPNIQDSSHSVCPPLDMPPWPPSQDWPSHQPGHSKPQTREPTAVSPSLSPLRGRSPASALCSCLWGPSQPCHWCLSPLSARHPLGSHSPPEHGAMGMGRAVRRQSVHSLCQFSALCTPVP